VAHAQPVTGARGTVDFTLTTTQPCTSAGFTYKASFRNPTNPGADPPPLRRLVIKGAEGSAIDTQVTTRCQVSDAKLRQEGEAACPPASRIGGGSAKVKASLLPTVSYRSVLFNADHDQLELLTGAPPAPNVVVHGYIKGDIIDSPIPTCINGGYVPKDCPTDQATLLSNTLSAPALTTGSGATRRAYFTTPPTCPSSGMWQTPVTFFYGDGVEETLVTEQPCVAPAKARPSLSVRIAAPRARAARGLRALRVSVRVRGAPVARRVRAAVRRIGRNGKPGRVRGRLRRPVTVRGKRVVALRLRRRGLSRGRYEVAVRAPGLRRTVRRFTVR